MNAASFFDISVIILLLASKNNYTQTHTHIGINTHLHTLNNALLKFKGKELVLGKFRLTVQLTIWKISSGTLKEYSPKSQVCFLLFQVTGTCHLLPIKLNPFSIHLAQYCLNIFYPAAKNVAFSLLPIISSASTFFSIASSQYFVLM